jgi:hypothetical protein
MTLTDDRGDYRIFGLAPGTYVVRAGGKFGASRIVTPHDNIVSSSYSQSRSGLPSPVEVSFGREASGIDIQLRDLQGFVVSGSVSGGPQMESASAFVTLEDIGTGAVFQGAIASREEGQRQLRFSFENVSDGNYRLTARTEDRGQSVFASNPMNLTVRGRDVHGVSLSMLRLPNVDGRVILTKRSVVEFEATCSTKSLFVMEEVVISALRTVVDEGRSVPNALPAVRIESVPTNNGDFTLRGLPAGTYRLRTQLPDANWYVQSLSILPSAAGGLPLDAARNGLSVKPGQREFKLQMHLARGAAQLRGQVIAQLGDRLPGDVTVHLVPEESGQGENILRFLQTQVGNKGSFEILNIPPGRYWMLARSGFSKAERLGSTVAAWEDLAGTQLLQEARAANQLLDLPVCRSIADYRLIYPPVAAGPSQGE